ncbi:MAG: hypothetical protein RLZZ306_1057, partial [Bacteroidota bacterium]
MINFKNPEFKYNYVWHYVFTIIISFLLGFCLNSLFFSWKSNITRNVQEIRIVNTPSNGIKPVKLDSIATLKLQNSIDLIESKNNGRFEVLTWSAYLVVLLFISFMTLNVIISTGK